MNTQTVIAVYAGNTQIGYGSLITVIALIASMMLTLSLCPVKETGEMARFRVKFSLFTYMIFAVKFLLPAATYLFLTSPVISLISLKMRPPMAAVQRRFQILS